MHAALVTLAFVGVAGLRRLGRNLDRRWMGPLDRLIRVVVKVDGGPRLVRTAERGEIAYVLVAAIEHDHELTLADGAADALDEVIPTLEPGDAREASGDARLTLATSAGELTLTLRFGSDATQPPPCDRTRTAPTA